MEFQWCLSVIWFLSCLPSSCLPSSCLPSSCLPSRHGNAVPLLECPVFNGESLFIKMPIYQCPESEISLRTQKKGSVFKYDKEEDTCTVDPRYQDRIQMKNDSNGRVIEFRNVTEEDMNIMYVIYASNTPLQRFLITSSTVSLTTTAAPHPSTATPGPSEVRSRTGLVVPVILVLCMGLVLLCVKIHKNSETKHLDMEAEQQNVENERCLRLYVPGRLLSPQDGAAPLSREGLPAPRPPSVDNSTVSSVTSSTTRIPWFFSGPPPAGFPV
ncbi:uncharacterized protein LOC115167490 [Salmo trutta]|uniref:uncharacterized protein LOC115167490 n=1 Tax=Salmo trutta TaxID=8032 RepID=UPI0011312A8B|nr:uncharacterized protein LOC115167490 [Salmo trutta]